MAQETLITVFEWLGSISSVVYFLTPLYQIVYLYKGQLHVKQIPLILLLSILLNCLFWILFGSIRPTIWYLMVATNSIGLIANTVLMLLYLYLLCDEQKWKFLGYGLFVINLVMEAAYVMYKFVILNNLGNIDEEGGIDVVGYIGMLMNVVMYASPAVNIIDVIKTKQIQFLPILTNSIGFLSTFIWLLYGVFKAHQKTMVSNGVSLSVLFIQIGIWLYFFYSAKKRKADLLLNDVEGIN